MCITVTLYNSTLHIFFSIDLKDFVWIMSVLLSRSCIFPISGEILSILTSFMSEQQHWLPKSFVQFLIFIGPYFNLLGQGADKRLGSVHHTKLERIFWAEGCHCVSATECIFEEALHPWHTEKFLKWDSKELVGVCLPLECVYSTQEKPVTHFIKFLHYTIQHWPIFYCRQACCT